MKRMKFVIISLVAIVFAMLAQETVSYFTTTGIAENTVTLDYLKLIVHEELAGADKFSDTGVYVMPGQVVEKVVTVENDCEQPFFLRVKLTHSINDEHLSVDGILVPEINEKDWEYRDGYYYYKYILEPHEFTQPLMTTVTVAGDKVTTDYLGKTLDLKVHAFAVQSKNNGTVAWEAEGWPSEEGGL